MKIEYIAENDNIRLSEELKLHTTRKFYKNLRCLNTVFYVNGEPLETYKEIHKGDIIHFFYEKNVEIEWPLYPSKLSILYEDDSYLVVSKRKGLLSIPTHGEEKSLYQEALYYLKGKNEPLTISILNRLDKETSGLMVLAKNRIAANALMPTHQHMVRKYLCLTHGIWEEKSGTIDTYIEKDIDSNKRRVSEVGKRAISHYQILEEKNDTSLVEFVLDTGRTHQIRLHTSYMGHPICGDPMYGYLDEYKDMQLHSYYVEFTHPVTKEVIRIIDKGEKKNEE